MIRRTHLASAALCSGCQRLHREGLPALWWRNHVVGLCRSCRADVRRALDDIDREEDEAEEEARAG